MPVLGKALLKKKLDFIENVNNEEECFLSALNAYLRYIYEELLFFSEESQGNQMSSRQIETEMFKIKIRLLLMSIAGKFSLVELPNVCWYVVGNEVMARFGVLVMQYLLVTKITYHPLVGEMLMNIYRYIYSYPLW